MDSSQSAQIAPIFSAGHNEDRVEKFQKFQTQIDFQGIKTLRLVETLLVNRHEDLGGGVDPADVIGGRAGIAQIKKLPIPTSLLSPSHTMAVLPTDTEVLLRKRKVSDKKRIQKQERLRIDKETQKKKPKTPRDKFVRAEHLAMKSLASMNEQKRLNNILKHELQRPAVSTQKEDQPKLVFVMRVEPHNKALSMPRMAENVLEALRLTENNMGVFVKLTATVEPALKLVAPYIVVGSPSLASVRHLFQKRASIYAPRHEGDEQEPKLQAEADEQADEPLRTIKLDNNQAVEDRFGDDLGLICVEDVIHEIVSLGENFKTVNLWLAPFHLTAANLGAEPTAKLQRIVDAEQNQKPVSMAGHTKLQEVDIDLILAAQN